MTPLSLSHLSLSARAESDVFLDGHKAGNALHNAIANVIRFATCPETHRRGAPTPDHVAACPACWLLANEANPGRVARAYTIEPPRPPRDRVPAGQSFTFGLTLYGDGLAFLPYFILAAAEAGRVGVGPGRRDGLGRFRLEAVTSHNPFTGDTRALLAPGDPVVRANPAVVVFDHARALADRLAHELAVGDNTLRLRFLSPMRLEEKEQLFKTPDFAVFFRRLLYRIDDLALNFCGGERRAAAERQQLIAAAEQVRLVEAQTRWIEQWSWSGRKQDRTPLGGFVGVATYHADDWTPLLPWLLLGQATHVGKTATKGNGLFEIMDLRPTYWTISIKSATSIA